jgi:hypothetical protein
MRLPILTRANEQAQPNPNPKFPRPPHTPDVNNIMPGIILPWHYPTPPTRACPDVNNIMPGIILVLLNSGWQAHLRSKIVWPGSP